jgi:tetratricopeptide (TPR) repeat protein
MDKIKELVVKVEWLKSEQKFNDAIKLLETSLTRYNSDYRLYEELADIYLYKWELDKWLKSVNFSLSLNQKSATWNYLKWFILLSQDKVNEAIKYLEDSNKILSNNSEVLRNLWWAYTMIWNSERWIMILKRALALSPNDELITEDLAMALIWAWNVTDWNNLLKKIWKTIMS